jgi:hypothetical protein
MKIPKKILKFFSNYSGDSIEDIEKAWNDWNKPNSRMEIDTDWMDRNCDCSGNCYSDTDSRFYF